MLATEQRRQPGEAVHAIRLKVLLTASSANRASLPRLAVCAEAVCLVKSCCRSANVSEVPVDRADLGAYRCSVSGALHDGNERDQEKQLPARPEIRVVCDQAVSLKPTFSATARSAAGRHFSTLPLLNVA
jgi:hypothetical protein